MRLSEVPTKIKQELRTGGLLLYNLRQHDPAVSVNTKYWDQTPDREFNGLVNHLGNPTNPERLQIRNILTSYQVESVLDAGCGPAAEYQSYRQNGKMRKATYVGVDGSQRMLQVAGDKYPGISLVRGELNKLPIASKSFDAVVIRHILEHQPEGYEKIVQEAVRVARKCVVIDFFHPPLPFIPKILPIRNKRGFADNWYNKTNFEDYLRSLQVKDWEVFSCRGSAGQRASIYAVKV